MNTKSTLFVISCAVLLVGCGSGTRNVPVAANSNTPPPSVANNPNIPASVKSTLAHAIPPPPTGPAAAGTK